MSKLADGYTIRLAEQLDIPALIAADRAASEMFRSTGLIPDMAAIPESIPVDILAEAIDLKHMIVAADGAGPVGFALVQPIENTLYLDQISVDPTHGRKGLGTALLREVYQKAIDSEYASVTLSTFRNVKWNGPFYRRAGFKEIARRHMADWMLEIEAAQSETMDVSQRCFMQRSVRRPLLAKRKSGGEQMTNPASDGTPSS